MVSLWIIVGPRHAIIISGVSGTDIPVLHHRKEAITRNYPFIIDDFLECFSTHTFL